MNIVIVSDSFIPTVGGTESHLSTVTKTLSARGHKVTLIIPNRSGDRTVVTRRSKKIKIKLIPYFKEYCLGDVGYNAIIPALFSIIQKINPDVIHVHNVGPCLAISHFSYALRAKICFTHHFLPLPGQKITGYFRNFGYELEKTFANFSFGHLRYDVLIARSEMYARAAVQLGASRNKILIVYPGIARSMFKPGRDAALRKQLGYRSDDFVVCAPIRLVERKGIFDFINAAKILRSDKIRLLVVTSREAVRTEVLQKVEQQTLHLRKQRRIRFIFDRFIFSNMPKLYRAVDVVVLPSHSDGFGLVAIEGMAAERPVIITETCGVAELMRRKRSGIVIPEKRPFILAHAIERLYSKPDLRQQLIRSQWQLVSNFLNVECEVTQLEEIYRKK